MKKLTPIEFAASRREPRLDYEVYEYNFDGPMDGFSSVRESLAYAEKNREDASSYDQMVWTKQRAWDSLDFLKNCYSGGHALQELHDLYPAVLHNWGEYAIRSKKFMDDEPESSKVAHIPLSEWEFSFANQLVSFDILFRCGRDMTQITSLLDFNNLRRDGMLERMINPFLSGRGTPPDDCIRHLPYFKTLKIIDAEPESRSTLMAEYLDDWYLASRREAYYDSHKKKNSFLGYWSWEAAAITVLLDIDDRRYKNSKFYPADLVNFARGLNFSKSNLHELSESELRAKSGEACPKAGVWKTLDIPLQQRNFAIGETMHAENASYGITIWRYIGD